MSRRSQPRSQRQPARRKQRSGPGRSLPAARVRSVTTRAPRVRSSGKGGNLSVTLSHREMLSPVYTGTPGFTSPFATGGFPLNPGLVNTFPWLSIMAAGFESYRFARLSFEFVPAVGTSKDGTVTMVPICDSDTNLAFSRQHGLSYAQASTAQVYAKQVCHFPKNALSWLGKDRLVRVGALNAAISTTATGDKSMYDVGIIAIAGIADGASFYAGDVYVNYEVTLTNPKRTAAVEYQSTRTFHVVDAPPTLPFWGASATAAGAGLAAVSGSNEIQINEAGDYLLDIHVDGNVITGLDPDMSASTGTSWSLLDKSYEAGFGSTYRYAVNTAADFMKMVFDFTGTWAGNADLQIDWTRAAVSVLESLGSLFLQRQAKRPSSLRFAAGTEHHGHLAPSGRALPNWGPRSSVHPPAYISQARTPRASDEGGAGTDVVVINHSDGGGPASLTKH